MNNTNVFLSTGNVMINYSVFLIPTFVMEELGILITSPLFMDVKICQMNIISIVLVRPMSGHARMDRYINLAKKLSIFSCNDSFC